MAKKTLLESDEPASAGSDVIDVVGKWGLVGFVGLTALGALVRMFAPSEVPVAQRVDQTTLLYLTVAGALLLLHKIKSFSLGEIRFEVFEKLRERQVKQEAKIDDIDLMLPLLLPAKEIRHLKNLANHNTARYRGSHALRGELRRLRSMGLIANIPNHGISELKDGTELDLANHVDLTPLGKRWVTRLWDIEELGEEGKKPDKTAEPA